MGWCRGVGVVDKVGLLLGRWVGCQGGSGYTFLYIPMAIWLIVGYTLPVYTLTRPLGWWMDGFTPRRPVFGTMFRTV